MRSYSLSKVMKSIRSTRSFYKVGTCPSACIGSNKDRAGDLKL